MKIYTTYLTIMISEKEKEILNDLRNKGINTSKIIRNFLIDYHNKLTNKNQ